MKKGDIVRCVNQGGGLYLTLGKCYKIIWADDNTVKVIGDLMGGDLGTNIFFKFRFENLHRENKLKRILK